MADPMQFIEVNILVGIGLLQEFLAGVFTVIGGIVFGIPAATSFSRHRSSVTTRIYRAGSSDESGGSVTGVRRRKERKK